MTQNLKKLRDDASTIFHSALTSVLPKNCIPNALKREGDNLIIQGIAYDLSTYKNLYLIAFGKASPGMFQAILPLVQEELTEAIIITNQLPENASQQSTVNCHYYEATHPLPSDQNIEAGKHVIQICEKMTGNDLALFLISGGGSSLFFAPQPGIPLEQYQSLVNELMKKGSDISELNTIRIALSRVKGGRLLQSISDATVVNLIISDVIGDPPELIASGPTVHPEINTFDQQRMMAKSLLEKYQLYRKHSDWLLPALEQKPAKSSQIEPDTFIIGSNRLALLAAKKKAQNLGYHTLLLSTMIEGESRDIGHLLATILLESIESDNPCSPPCCILSGGETTVTVRGEGKGGRNQELALGAAEIFRDVESGLIFSAGTDGIDGPTDAAGAIVDSTTAFRAVHEGLSIKDSMYHNDSYHFFNALDDLIITGPTGTNVMDIQICLIA